MSVLTIKIGYGDNHHDEINFDARDIKRIYDLTKMNVVIITVMIWIKGPVAVILIMLKEATTAMVSPVSSRGGVLFLFRGRSMSGNHGVRKWRLKTRDRDPLKPSAIPSCHGNGPPPPHVLRLLPSNKNAKK